MLSADGRTLYAVSASSVLGIDVGSLTVRRTLLQNQQVNGLALAPDGRYLLALLPGGDIMEIPTAAGAPQALLRPAVTPFAILRVVA